MRLGCLGRTLRFFVRIAQRYVLFSAALSTLMAFYMCLVNGNHLNEIIKLMPAALFYYSAVVLFVSGMSGGQQWYPILVSFGCIRRDVWLGILLLETLFIAEILVIYEIVAGFADPAGQGAGALLILAGYLAVEGLAKLAGVAALKWGRMSFFLLAAGVFVLSIVFALWIVSADGEGLIVSFVNSLMEGRASLNGQCAAVFAGAAVCIVGNAASWPNAKKL